MRARRAARACALAVRGAAGFRGAETRSYSSGAVPPPQQRAAASRLSALLLLTPCALTAGLGVWQLQRREWKLEQLAERERQLTQPPLPLRTLSAGEAGEWRRVEGQGELRGRASYVGPRVRTVGGTARKGYLLIETLQPADGGPPVLLNRGWVPAEWREAREHSPEAPSCVRFVGITRRSERPSSFVPTNTGDDWFWIDVPALAAAAGLPPSTPLVEVIAPPRSAGGAAATGPSYPQAQAESALLRFPVMPDDHRNYAATWLTLAAAVGLLGVGAIRTRAAAVARQQARLQAADTSRSAVPLQ